jgi:serine phosphatase RsbU (regulator of sigma subunit)
VRADTAYESVVISLAPGERFLFLTDGLPEAPRTPGDPLGYERLTALFPADSDAPATWLDQLFAALRAATSPALEDDWTALLLEASR